LAKVKDDGIWKRLTGIRVKVSSNWKPVTRAYHKVSGAWQEVFGNPRPFVAVGQKTDGSGAGIVLKTYDGVTWSTQYEPSWGVMAVATNGQRYVTVSYRSNEFAYTDDLSTWTSGTLPVSQDWLSLSFGNGVFIAAGAGLPANGYATDKIAISQDGASWSLVTMPQSVTNGMWALASADFSRLYIFTTGNMYFTSIDGLSWSYGYLPMSYRSAASGAGKIVVINYASSDISYSLNGTSWTKVSGALPAALFWKEIAYGNGMFVAIATGSGNTRMAYSSDGISWSEGTMPIGSFWQTVSYVEDRFVALGSGDHAAYSYDGINWVQSQSPISATWRKIV
jgi:hypothetical protein